MTSQPRRAEFEPDEAGLLFGEGIVRQTLALNASLHPHLPFNKMAFVCQASAGDAWVAFELKWDPSRTQPVVGSRPDHEIERLAERATSAGRKARVSELSSTWSEDQFVYFGPRLESAPGLVVFSWSDAILMYKTWLNQFHVARARELSQRGHLDQSGRATVQSAHNPLAAADSKSEETPPTSLRAVDSDTDFSSEEFRRQLRDGLKLLVDVTERGETRQTQLLEDALRELRRLDLKTQTSLADIVASLTPDQRSLLQRIREEMTRDELVGVVLRGSLLSELVLNVPLT